MPTVRMHAQANRRTAAPRDLGSRLELFVDRSLIESLDRVEFRLHEPQRMPLPLSPPQGLCLTVIKDGDLDRTSFRGDDPSYTGPRNTSGLPGAINFHAGSRDGLKAVPCEFTGLDAGVACVEGITRDGLAVDAGFETRRTAPVLMNRRSSP